MMRYKLVIAYDGTSYHGWQEQPDQVTVAGTLQKTFENVFKQPITIVGASRTDAGVHSLGQVAHFTTDIQLSPERLLFAWTNSLPLDIKLRSITPVSLEFHAQKNVLEKTYYYMFFTERPLPFWSRYGFYYKKSFDKELLSKALSIFNGTHDFRSFCTGYDQDTTIRHINSIRLGYNRRYRSYYIIVQGPGFLRYMIRRIVGSALDVASYKYSLEDLKYALQEKDPEQPFTTAPACGLLLRRICYA
ncbi:MAG TPA: tRNA pseudouridine(38-40) synthase TruA [Candidatus Babeliaceae bacterium]|nr:tRNA pseudouridine(38-40) synthase TruA [Candidatus Babeliaceae bacterium]